MSRILFVLAHPDDEAFIAGTIFMLNREGHELHACWVTSGDARGNAGIRERELLDSCRIVGLRHERVHLLRLPNRGLLPILRTGTQMIGTLLDEIKPAGVFTTAFEGGDLDHDCVNYMTFRAVEHTCELYEFPLYNRCGKIQHLYWLINEFCNLETSEQRKPLNPEALDAKYAVMKAHRSQWRDMLPFRLFLTPHKLMRAGEPCRMVSRQRDFTSRPHFGHLNYEGIFFKTGVIFDQFVEAVRKSDG
jgi:LmbE family N-acetylglucosaminyl deacetylase